MNDEESAVFLKSAQEVIRALVFAGRPPGTGSTILGFSGHDSSGDAIELRRQGEEFVLHPPGQTEKAELISVEDVLHRLSEKSIRLENLVMIPEVAEALFPHAVREAERSLGQYFQAIDQAASMGKGNEGDPDPLAFVMWASALDRTIPASITAIVLSVATAEAQVNESMAMLGVREQEEASAGEKGPRLPRIVPKLKALAAHGGQEIDVDTGPWSELRALVRRRNELVHSTPRETHVPLMGGGRETLPGYGWTLEARRACFTVRSALVALADICGLEPPRYLAYCPPAPPEDDDAWRAASIMTGARDDPDFPRASRGSKS